MKKGLLVICSVLLLLVASIAVLGPGCNGTDLGYELDMAENPAAGGTATDLTGASSYLEGDEANIQAVAASCYQFTGWTSSDGGTFDDPDAATTNFTMPAQDVTVTANFALKPVDHYRVYEVDYETAPYIGQEVELVDQFGTFTRTVEEAVAFGNPVDKTYKGELTPKSDENNHLTLYLLSYEEDEVLRSVEVTNQFGTHNLSVYGPVALAVPTQKLVPGDHDKWDCVDHFLVYEVDIGVEMEGVYVDLEDQFGALEQGVEVYAPVLFANPVQKTCGTETTDIENPNLENHLVIYWTGSKEYSETVEVYNQFNQFLDGEDQTLDLEDAELLAVPSQKNVPPTPPLDHFKCYNATGPAPILPPGVEGLELLDQFHDYWLEAAVSDVMLFCNPVDKVHGTVTTTSNEDNHLTVYKIGAAIYWYTVTIDNQFNEPTVPQTLTVFGPVALATPTQKLSPGDHGMPKYIDHYLLYEVWEPEPVNAIVTLDDQFPGSAEGVTVAYPKYFANPCLKGPVDLGLEGLWDPEEHLLFYEISENDEFLTPVTIRNQFFQDEFGVPLDLFDNWELLAVPSVKVEWSIME
jgi:uncharacterized repeat protein (TIGR02543 family)